MGVSRPGPQGMGPIWRRSGFIVAKAEERDGISGGRKQARINGRGGEKGHEQEQDREREAFLQCRGTYDGRRVPIIWGWSRREKEGRKGNGQAREMGS